jgi:preprotein translocase subunit YajC
LGVGDVVNREIASAENHRLAMTLLMQIIYNRFIMTKKYRKQRQLTPAWLDMLIGGLEVLAAIGGIFGAIYALISLFEMFSK